MGLRSFGKGLFFILFTTFLAFFLIVSNLTGLINYDSLKPIFSQITTSLIPEEIKNINITESQLGEARAYLEEYCKDQKTINITDIAAQFNFDINQLPPEFSTINCSDIENAIPENVSSLQAADILSNTLFDSIYNRNYSCDFIECILNARSPTDYLVIFSQKFNDFLLEAKYYLLFLTVATLAAFILLAETLTGRIKGVGWGMLSVGITPLIFYPIQSLLLPQLSLPENVQGVMDNVINPIINSLFTNFYIVLIIGIVLLAAGYVLGFAMKPKAKADNKLKIKVKRESKSKKKS